MSEASVKCERCKIPVAISKLDMRDRCCDHLCPLNSAADNARHEADWRRSVGQIVASVPAPAAEPKQPSQIENRFPPKKADAAPIILVVNEVDNSGHGARVAADLAARKVAREAI